MGGEAVIAPEFLDDAVSYMATLIPAGAGVYTDQDADDEPDLVDLDPALPHHTTRPDEARPAVIVDATGRPLTVEEIEQRAAQQRHPSSLPPAPAGQTAPAGEPALAIVNPGDAGVRPGRPGSPPGRRRAGRERAARRGRVDPRRPPPAGPGPPGPRVGRLMPRGAQHRPAPILPTVTMSAAALTDIARRAQSECVEAALNDPDRATYAAGVRDLALYLSDNQVGAESAARLARVLRPRVLQS